MKNVTVSLVRVVALGGIVVSIAGTASAQVNKAVVPDAPERLKVELGVFQPSDAQARAHSRNDWFVLSLSYDIKPLSTDRRTNLAAYFDLGTGFGSTRLGDGSFHTFGRDFYGVGLSTNIPLMPPHQHTGAYVLAGAGLYSLYRGDSRIFETTGFDEDGQPVDIVDGFSLNHASTVNLGYKLGVGFEFGHGLSLEGSYFGLGKLENADYSGVGVMLGWRI